MMKERLSFQEQNYTDQWTKNHYTVYSSRGRYGDKLFESQRDFKNVLVVILGIIIVGYGFGL